MSGKTRSFVVYSLDHSGYLANGQGEHVTDVKDAFHMSEGMALDFLVGAANDKDPWKGYVLCVAPTRSA